MLLASAALLIAVVGPVVWSLVRGPKGKPAGSGEQVRAERSPARLPIRQDDYLRFPRESFGFVLENQDGEKVDTFQGLVTKDLVSRPDTTIPLVLSRSEMDRIYRKVIEIRLFEYPEPHPPIRMDRRLSHGTETHLLISAGSAKRRLQWNTGWVHARGPSDQWKRLEELGRLIRQLVEARREYRALPEPMGRYL